MYIFIDESNIHNFIGNSTFVLVYIEVDNYSKITEKILAIEKELSINNFHWSESTLAVKDKFLERILSLDFKFKLAVIKNPINPLKEMERILPHMAIETKLTKCAHCGCKMFECGHKERIKEKDLLFCCKHCANSFKHCK